MTGTNPPPHDPGEHGMTLPYQQYADHHLIPREPEGDTPQAPNEEAE